MSHKDPEQISLVRLLHIRQTTEKRIFCSPKNIFNFLVLTERFHFKEIFNYFSFNFIKIKLRQFDNLTFSQKSGQTSNQIKKY